MRAGNDKSILLKMATIRYPVISLFYDKNSCKFLMLTVVFSATGLIFLIF